MAIIYCTGKMEKWLGKVNPLPEAPQVENTWNTQVLTINRKNWVYCIHNPTAYSLLIPEVKKSEMNKFGSLFYPRLVEQMTIDGIDAELIAKFPQTETVFYKTNNHKRIIGVMNSVLGMLSHYVESKDELDLNSIAYANNRLNKYLIGKGKSYVYALDEMNQYLGGEPLDVALY